MHKVYLLLRNNKQEGPYSLDELLTLGLKPYDLIRVEGKSFSWSHPAEVEALKPYVTTEAPKQTPTPSSREEIRQQPELAAGLKKVFVSLPGNKERLPTPVKPTEPQADDLERKADELRKRAENYLQNKSNAVGEEFSETKYTRSLNEVEEDYTSWVYNKVSKKKTFNKKPLLLTAIAIAALAAGYFMIGQTSEQEIYAPKTAITVQPTQTVEKEELGNVNGTENDETPAEEFTGAVNEDKINSKKDLRVAMKEGNKEINSSANNSKPKSHSTIPAATTVGTNAPQETVQTEIENTPAKSESEPVAAQPEEKKKTLKEKIGGFFEKIKSKKTAGTETPEETSTPGTTTNGSERKATKRGESENTSGGSADLSSYVKVSTNQSSGNWMMGVRGLKVILRNNGTEAIKAAVVEVRYYNDENNLLEKKLVQFANVPPKKSITQPAPDHRLADHTEVILISAVGDIGYAKQ